MNWREVMQRGGQDREAHGRTCGRTDEVQAPSKELFFFGGTIATINPPAHFATPPRPDTLTHGKGQGVNHEHFTLRGDLAEHFCEPRKPISECVEAAIEARETQRFGKIMGF